MNSSPAILVASLALTAASLQAATVAYYRFETPDMEPATFADSGDVAPSVPLDNDGGMVLDASAQNFPSTIPQTGASNGRVLSFFGSDDIEGTDAKFQVSSFTIEGYFSFNNTGASTQYFASRWRGSDGNRSFGIGIADNNGTGSASANTLFAILSEDGDSTTVVASGLPELATDTVYYFGMSYADATTGNDTVFYLQDITNGGALLSNNVDSGIDTNNVGTNSEFRLGGISSDDGGSPSNTLGGRLDEIRLSNVVLSESELLAVPEPGSTVLLLGTLGLLAVRRRRGGRA